MTESAGSAFAGAFNQTLGTLNNQAFNRRRLEQQEAQFADQQRLERAKLAQQIAAQNGETLDKQLTRDLKDVDAAEKAIAAAIEKRGEAFLANPTKLLQAYEATLNRTNATLDALGQPNRPNMFEAIVQGTATPEEAGTAAGVTEAAKLTAQTPAQVQAASQKAAGAASDAVRDAPKLGAAQGTTAAVAAKGEAQAKVTKAKASLGAIFNEPDPQRQESLAQLLGGAVSTDSFFRTLNAFDAENDPEKRALLMKRLNKLSENQGFSMALKDGKLVALTQGGDVGTILSGLKSRDQLKVIRAARGLAGDIAFTQNIIDRVDQDPASFGAAGSIRGAIQSISQGTEELDALIPGLGGAVGAIRQELAAIGAPEVISGFDESLSQIELLENALAFRVARLRMERSGGDIRALSSVMKDAKEDIKLSGATTAASVKARLKVALDLFKAEHKALTESINAQPEASTGTQAPSQGRTVIRFDENGNQIQ